MVRRVIRAAKRACWRQYCNRVGQETQLSDVWGIVRKMSGIRRSITIPILISNNRTGVSCLEKATLLAETLKFIVQKIYQQKLSSKGILCWHKIPGLTGKN